jgi:hypothetical protein
LYCGIGPKCHLFRVGQSLYWTNVYAFVVQINLHFKDICTRCVFNYRRWSGRSHHNQIKISLLIAYTCRQMWVQSEFGQYLDNGRMFKPGINWALDRPSQTHHSLLVSKANERRESWDIKHKIRLFVLLYWLRR